MRVFWLLFSFQGRIGRLSFWFGGLILLVVSVVVFGVTAAATRVMSPTGEVSLASFVDLLPYTATPSAIVGLANLALTTKRLHDRDKSALWLLLLAVPIIGPLWLLIETGALAGTPGPNRYGPPQWTFAEEEQEGIDAEDVVRRWQEKESRAAATRPRTPPSAPAAMPRGTPPDRPVFGRRGRS